MKKILISIILLIAAIFTMAYLYFSKLNTDQNSTDIGLYAAISSSGFIFSFENDKSVTDILKEQNLFKEILGQEKYEKLNSIKEQLLFLPKVTQATNKQNIYVSFISGNNREIDFLFSTQLNDPENSRQILKSLKNSVILLDTLNLTKLILKDNTVCYIGIKQNLVLLSNSPQPVLDVLSKDLSKKNDSFIEYIHTTKRFTKNSLALVYLNFNKLPTLLKNIIPGKLTGELSVLDNQNSFASLTYNFSNEKILLTGTTKVNDPNSYYNLFSALQPQKITINNILPDNTSNYILFSLNNYHVWRTRLNNWFIKREENKKITGLIQNINIKYHLNLNDIFPEYFKNQFITFQLGTTEKIGAINLSNGDKVMQLLLDLSNDYNDEIKVFKESDLLYAYFGQPFKNFKRPFYIIIDNYMIFANNASTLQSFLNRYKNNKLLINSPNYINVSNQLPANSNISIYIDHQNSANIFRNNIYLPYYKHIRSEKGLKKYDSFTYQLSGDNGKFQTNVLINKQPDILQKDSLAL